jgi:hypothetical protein
MASLKDRSMITSPGVDFIDLHATLLSVSDSPSGSVFPTVESCASAVGRHSWNCNPESSRIRTATALDRSFDRRKADRLKVVLVAAGDDLTEDAHASPPEL